MVALGIDLGGTRIKIGLVDDNGVVVDSTVLPNNSTPADLDAVVDASRRLGQGAPVGGVGVAVPGVVRPDGRGMSLAAAKYAYLETTDLVAWSHDAFGIPAVVENDARAALVGEVAAGCARGYRDVVMVILGTGIGTAALMGGHLLRGRSGHAGILGGHQTVALGGPVCPCGNVGCGEALAATWNVADVVARARRVVAAATTDQLSGPTAGSGPVAGSDPVAGSGSGSVAGGGHDAGADPRCEGDPLAVDGWRGVAAAAESDPVARAVLADATRTWAAVTASMVLAYDPELVVLSGGVLRASDVVVPAVRDYLDHHLWGSLPRPRIEVAKDPEHSVVLGMATLAASPTTAREFDGRRRLDPLSTHRSTPTLEH